MRLSKSVFALGLLDLLTVPAWADSDLEFPCNDQITDGQTVRFKFTSPHTNGLPVYGPGGAGLTYIFEVRAQTANWVLHDLLGGTDDGAGGCSANRRRDMRRALLTTHPVPGGYTVYRATACSPTQPISSLSPLLIHLGKDRGARSNEFSMNIF